MFKLISVGIFFIISVVSLGQSLDINTEIDPITRYVKVHYRVPDGAPDEIKVRCEYRVGDGEWRAADVRKYRSKTAEYALAGSEVMHKERISGTVTEKLAAGRIRTLVWMSYPQIGIDYKGPIDLRVRIFDIKGRQIAEGDKQITLDMNGVVVLDDFSKLMPKVWEKKGDNEKFPGWYASKKPAMLECVEGKCPLEPLSWRVGVKGYYAIFVAVPKKPNSSIDVRLSSDFYYQRFDGFDGREYFWKIAKMDNENIIISQPYRTQKVVNDEYRARLNYIRLVPISKEVYSEYTKFLSYKKDKLVFAYFEPYSWAFNEYVDRTGKLLEPMAAFRDADVDLVDAQFGRLGARPVYPSMVEEPLLGETMGDANPGGNAPHSKGVAKLALLTNPLKGCLAGSRAFGIAVSANFGSGINYYDSPLEGEFSKTHPQWIHDRYWLMYKYKGVREHFLKLYEEQLEMGARILSLDFCRYPFVIDDAKLPTLFLTELRKLADRYSKGDNRVKIIVRFPVPGCKGAKDYFRPAEWIDKRLVDYIVPGDLAGNTTYFDIRKYVNMVRGTRVKCLPCVNAQHAYFIWPGEILRRIKQCYDEGADGIYIYQADAAIVGSMTSGIEAENKHYVPYFSRSKAVDELLKQFERENENYSTDIYVFYPLPYQSERVRVWIEGGKAERVKMYVDGKLMNDYRKPPYFLGKEGYKNNYPFINKPVTVKIEAKINGKWLTKIYKIKRIFWSSH